MSTSSGSPRPQEPAYLRKVLFAVELLDAVTLSRVSQGLKVVAEGLRGTPIVNAGGLFVWLDEDVRRLKKITIDPGTLPYESVELAADELTLPLTTTELTLPLTTIELPPRVDYTFAAGMTGLRGALIEERALPPRRPVPVTDAAVRLRWLDEDGVTWRDAPTRSHTMRGGSFAAILRLAATDAPQLDAAGALTIQLRARRGAMGERRSAELKLPQGRIADPETYAQGPGALTFAWDELQL